MIARTSHPVLPLIAMVVVWAIACAARAQIILSEEPEQARGVEVVERIGESVPLDLMLMNHDGAAVALREYFGDGKPAVLALGYYDCPLVCPLILERLARSISGVDFNVGRGYRVIVVSFDPTNSVSMAARARRDTILAYDRRITPEMEEGFVFHVASEGNARRLADSIGYKYRRLPNGEYSHPVALAVLTPDGVIARYLYGFDYPPRDLELALMEAADGRVSGRSIGAMVRFSCFDYDPTTGSYTFQAMALMKLCAIASMLLLFPFIGLMLWRERARRRSRSAARLDAGGRGRDRRRKGAHTTGRGSSPLLTTGRTT